MHGAKSKHYNAQQILQKLPLCEAAPERELAQESKALLQQRSRMLLEAVRSEVDIFHSKYCKSYLFAKRAEADARKQGSVIAMNHNVAGICQRRTEIGLKRRSKNDPYAGCFLSQNAK